MKNNNNTALTEGVRKIKSLLGAELCEALQAKNFARDLDDSEKLTIKFDVEVAAFDFVQVRFSRTDYFEVRFYKIGETVPYAVFFPFESNFKEAFLRYASDKYTGEALHFFGKKDI